MRNKKSNGRNNRSRKFRGGGGGGGGGGSDLQSLARQKKHALTQKEKYSNMARDALSNGDRVEAEYYFQHVEHYSRVLADIAAREPAPRERESHSGDDEAAYDGGDAAEPGNEAAGDDGSDDEEIPLPASMLNDRDELSRTA